MHTLSQAAIQQVITDINKARSLAAQHDDDSEPYKSKYSAANTLLATEQQATASADSETADSTPDDTLGTAAAAAAAEVAARCKLERGLVLLETDLTAQGQKALEEGLAYSWPADAASLEIQQQAHNALAALWCERAEHKTALQHLQAAAGLYDQIQKQHQQLCSVLPLDGTCVQVQEQQQHTDPDHTKNVAAASSAMGAGINEAASSGWQAPLYDPARVEASYTTTLFYLAQVHGHMGDRQASASYCAATLNRQLKAGSLDLNDWVQNCLQLSGYFLDCNAFALSEYCCAAVEALLLRELHSEQQQEQGQVASAAADSVVPGPDASTKAGEVAAQHQQQQQAEADVSEQDQAEGKDQAVRQQQQPAGKEGAAAAAAAAAAGGKAGSSSPAGLQAALALLEADVAANVCLAFAKRQLYCLVASHEAMVEGRQVTCPFSGPADVPAVLCFDALQALPHLDSLAWGKAALACSHSQALVLYKAAMPWFKQALVHYQLDGWVTQHCNILFEMSNLYRCLAGFESDPHKRCVLHRSRAKLLQPLEGELSSTHYPGLSRSISLELGNIFREIADIKAAAGREPDKVCAAMRSAARHYKLFVDSFRCEESGALPDRVEPDMEQHFLSGMFSMARMLQGLPGTGTIGSSAAAAPDNCREDLASLQEAVTLLDCFAKYVNRNHLDDWQEQADMACELGGLLQEKMSLLQAALERA